MREPREPRDSRLSRRWRGQRRQGRPAQPARASVPAAQPVAPPDPPPADGDEHIGIEAEVFEENAATESDVSADVEAREEIVQCKKSEEAESNRLRQALVADPGSRAGQGDDGVRQHGGSSSSSAPAPTGAGALGPAPADVPAPYDADAKPGHHNHPYAMYEQFRGSTSAAGHDNIEVPEMTRPIGQLQLVKSWDGYSMTVRCKIKGHTSCSRTIRHVDRVLIKWVLAGRDPEVNTTEKHMKMPRE